VPEARAEPWGTTASGAPAARIVLENAVGTRAVFTEFGATLCALHVPDRAGGFANVVLGLPSLAAYEASRRRMGCVIGRYAGRIGGASFELDGKSYRLHRGPAGPALHGGPDGFDRRLWKHCLHVDRRGAQVGFVLVSPDGDQRFPGTLEVEVSYRLPLERHALEISYRARTDAPTVINLTNHAFFNLRGAGAQGLRSHRFRIDASRIAHTDLLGVPTGVLDPVAGTDADFTRLQALRAAAGHDCSYVFDDARSVLRPVALIEETESGRRMAVHTTEPSAQFFTGNGFDGSETGAEGRAYLRHDGFAFETQHLPDSPNHPSFPTTALYPGQEYRSVTILEFTA